MPGCLPSWLLVAAGSPGARWQSCCSLLQLTVLFSAQVRASIGPAQLSEGLGIEDGTPIHQVLPGESFKTIY